MKKIIFILAAVSISVAANAQFEIRPFIGTNFSDIQSTPDGTSTQAKLGAQLGANLLIGNKLHIMPGINVFSRSTEYSTPSDQPNFDQTTNGVMIPILIGYRFIDMDNDPFFNVRAFAGPSLMFLTKTELSNGVADDVVDWNNSQWGAQVGLGLDIAMFFVDLGYEWGLSKTGDVKGVPEWDDIKSNTFFVNVGARLKFAR
jgi:opacity protein-like surface antigen